MPEWAVNTPWWVFVGFVIALIGAGVWVGKVNTKLGSLGEGLAEVRKDIKEGLAEVRKSFDEDLAGVRKSFGEGLTEVRADIKKILERQATPPAVQANSPVRLTSFGEKISAAASAREWAVEHASRLTDEVPGKQEFEVFETCVAYVAEQIEKDEVLQRNIRKAAYELGTEAEQVRKVYEVELAGPTLVSRLGADLTG